MLGTSRDMDQVRAIGRFVASFFKESWSLGDYPVRILHRPVDPAKTHGRLKPFAWTAQIVNWWHMRGDGHSRGEALASLQERFSRFREANLLPRPGRGAALKVEMAPSGVVEANAEIVDDILERVIGCAPGDCLVTDESSLWDFHSGEDNREYFRKDRHLVWCRCVGPQPTSPGRNRGEDPPGSQGCLTTRCTRQGAERLCDLVSAPLPSACRRPEDRDHSTRPAGWHLDRTSRGCPDRRGVTRCKRRGARTNPGQQTSPSPVTGAVDLCPPPPASRPEGGSLSRGGR